MERRLAAILAADVVGYSRLIEADEAGTLAAMKTHRRELWTPKIEAHGGRVVGTAGDSILVEFASAVAAVECAIGVQHGVALLNAGVSDDRRMLLRVGINIGEVVVDGEDIHGDGVNVAARLEALCEAGGIAISGNVHEQVQGKIEAHFEDTGEHAVKNITRPIRVWKWTETTTKEMPAVPEATEPLSLPDKPSIAVLPFTNMSGDPEQEYFADGMAEDIITALSKYRSFFVSARNSTFTYKGGSVDVKQVGRELGVRYVLEGSVRRDGNRVRITAQLIETASSNHIWAERYDREIVDLFDLQDEITRSIVTTVIPELSDAEHARAMRKPPQSLDAWELYQRGMWHAYRMTEDDAAEAERFMRRAIKSDKTFAAPWAGLAMVLHFQTDFLWTDEKGSLWPEALEAARKAIKLDERDALAYAVMARILLAGKKLPEAIHAAQRAVGHNDNSSFANMTMSFVLSASGRASEAFSHAELALRLSPRDPMRWAFEITRGLALVALRRYEESEQSLKTASLYDQAGFWPHVHLANLYVLMGRIEDARKSVRQAMAMRPGLTISHVITTSAVAGKKGYEHYLENLKLVGLPE